LTPGGGSTHLHTNSTQLYNSFGVKGLISS
jgi:hypothetical protein